MVYQILVFIPDTVTLKPGGGRGGGDLGMKKLENIFTQGVFSDENIREYFFTQGVFSDENIRPYCYALLYIHFVYNIPLNETNSFAWMVTLMPNSRHTLIFAKNVYVF